MLPHATASKPVRLQAGRHHLRRRRLAVGAGNREVRHRRDPGAELHLAEHREPALARPPQDVGVRRHAGARHDQGRTVEVFGQVAAVEHLDAQRPQILGRAAGAPGLAHPHRGALGHEHTRRRRAGDAGADHDRVLALERAHHSSPSPPRLTKSV
jgi:hypothetical protein